MICKNLSVNSLGHLEFAGLDTVELVKEYKTPLYLLDEDRIRYKLNVYKNAMAKAFGEGSFPAFASKAMSFQYLYKVMSDEKVFVDLVSPGEIYTAYKAGFDLENSFFHGNNKTDEDLSLAVDLGVGRIVSDNAEELYSLDRIAGEKGINQKILIRLTPGIDPHTHKKINTGRVDSKFGAAIETGDAERLVKIALGLKNITLVGFHCHIGSQIFESEPFIEAGLKLSDFSAQMRDIFGFIPSEINLGGGMGVKYLDTDPDIDYASNIEKIGIFMRERLDRLSLPMPKVFLEPGRSIVADAGLTLYTVGAVKEIAGYKNYVSIDGGMADNPRYTLYGSPYTVLSANKADKKADYPCTLAGRCCESGDIIQENILLAGPEKGDIIAVCTTGAYNYSMASNYNRLTRPPVVMIKDGKTFVAVKRESFDDLIRNDM